MNIVPYRAKLPDLPLPEKRHGGASGQFRGKGIHTHGKDKAFN